MESDWESIEKIKQKLKKRILERLDFIEEIDDEGILDLIDEEVLQAGKNEYLPVQKQQRLRQDLFNGIRKLDILQEILDDGEITEIMINGWQNIFIEKQGRIHKWKGCFESRDRLMDIIQQIAAKANRTVNEASPIVDARLEDGSRVHVVLSPVSLDGAAVTIRKFPQNPITMDELIRIGTISAEAATMLKSLVRAKYNIFISGGTGSGKTTFLNALSKFISRDERVITIEDSAELKLQEIPNLVRLETRNPILEESRGICMQELIKAALRMRPDIIIIGEVRDGEAVMNMLQALNTGHTGMSTGHANSAKDMLGRLETLELVGMDMPLISARKQIASAIDIIVHIGRLRDKSRRVLEISEIAGCVDGEIALNPLFLFEEEMTSQKEKVQGRLNRCKNQLLNKEKLERAGEVLSEGLSENKAWQEGNGGIPA